MRASDASGRLVVSAPEPAEIALDALLGRLGGTRVARRLEGPQKLILVDVIVTAARYPELLEGLGKIGRWTIEHEPKTLPSQVRVEVAVTVERYRSLLRAGPGNFLRRGRSKGPSCQIRRDPGGAPMRRFISAVLLAAAVLPPGGPAAAAAAAAPLAITRESQRDLMVTIYNGNLGLVKDTREARLPAGMSEVQFADVAAQIDPTSVHLKSLTDPAGLRILEQNYEYDLLSAQKLLEKYVGKKVRLYQGNGTYLEATLLSTDGPVYDINGADPHGAPGPDRVPRPAGEPRVEAHAALAPPERRGRAPAGRGLVPDRGHQLEVGLRGDPQRRRRPRRSHGLGDHRQQERRHLQGRGAEAGRRRRQPRARDRDAPATRRDGGRRRPRRRRPSRDFVSEGFFEYHLYTLDGRTTIKDNQTKQLTLHVAPPTCRCDKELTFFGARDYYRSQYGTPLRNQKVGVFVELTQREGEQPRGAAARRARSASTRRTRPAASSSSARTGSTTRRRTSRCGSRWARPSTSWASASRRTGRRSAGQPLRGRVGDQPPQPQEGGRDRRA